MYDECAFLTDKLKVFTVGVGTCGNCPMFQVIRESIIKSALGWSWVELEVTSFAAEHHEEDSVETLEINEKNKSSKSTI